MIAGWLAGWWHRGALLCIIMGNLKGYGVAAAAVCATTLSTTKTAFITMVDKCVTAHTAYVNELVIVGKVNRFVHCDRYTYCWLNDISNSEQRSAMIITGSINLLSGRFGGEFIVNYFKFALCDDRWLKWGWPCFVFWEQTNVDCCHLLVTPDCAHWTLEGISWGTLKLSILLK